MKIVYTHKNDIETNGLSVVFASVYGENFKLWDVNQKPIFDVFDELKPDLLIIHNEYLNELVYDVLNEYNKTKVIIISNETNKKYPCIKPCINLANVIQFGNGKIQEHFKTDIVYWSRNPNITDELLSLLDFLYNRYSLKIFGPVRIDMPQYLGTFTISETANILASSTINLDFNNNSRFDAIINGTLSIYYEEDNQPWINNLESIPKFLEQDNLYKSNVKKIIKQVKKEQTFHHHASNIFNILNWEKESDKVLQKLAEIL